MTINTPRLLIISAVLFASAIAAGQDAPAKEIVVLSPFQVVAKSLEMEVHYSTHQGKKTIEYIRVKNVAKDSRADRAGLKNGDRIVALAGWRLEGQELTALNRDFTLKLQDGEPVFILTVRRPHHDEEHDIALPFPQKKRPQNENSFRFEVRQK
jgi:predicted metalloprotease with PDZ domain